VGGGAVEETAPPLVGSNPAVSVNAAGGRCCDASSLGMVSIQAKTTRTTAQP